MRHRGLIWIAVILIAGIFVPLFVIHSPHPVNAAIDYIVINEVYYNSTDWENSIFIEILNPTSSLINIGGWTLETEFYGQRWRFPAYFAINPTEMVVIFPDATTTGDFSPSDCILAREDINVYVLETDSQDISDQDNPDYLNLFDDGGTGDLRFNVTGDYILLKNSTGSLVDAFVWGSSNYTGHVSAPVISAVGHSMERISTTTPVDTDDCSIDFIEVNKGHPGDFYGTLVQTLPKQASFAIFFAMLAILSLALFHKRKRKK
ncbi:MAG: lamin tail domain-containing protein [Candidatus Hodarchaeota archaeon]